MAREERQLGVAEVARREVLFNDNFGFRRQALHAE
jgi:hypothetical protein